MALVEVAAAALHFERQYPDNNQREPQQMFTTLDHWSIFDNDVVLSGCVQVKRCWRYAMPSSGWCAAAHPMEFSVPKPRAWWHDAHMLCLIAAQILWHERCTTLRTGQPEAAAPVIHRKTAEWIRNLCLSPPSLSFYTYLRLVRPPFDVSRSASLSSHIFQWAQPLCGAAHTLTDQPEHMNRISLARERMWVQHKWNGFATCFFFVSLFGCRMSGASWNGSRKHITWHLLIRIMNGKTICCSRDAAQKTQHTHPLETYPAELDIGRLVGRNEPPPPPRAGVCIWCSQFMCATAPRIHKFNTKHNKCQTQWLAFVRNSHLTISLT